MMMKRLRILLWIAGLSLVAGCSSRGPVFEKYHALSNSTWDRFNQLVFTIPIEAEEGDYDISLLLRPTPDFPYDRMPVYVILNTPSGEERMTEIKVPVRENGKFIGEEEGKPVEVKAYLWKSIRISKSGKCKLSIENIVPKIQTPGIKEIGIRVEKAKPAKAS